jgi:hypothetical protein
MKIAANALIPIVVLRGRFNRAAWPPRPAAGLDVTSQSCNASERRWTNSKSSKDLDLETKAKIWSSLSCICHIRSTADAAHGAVMQSGDGGELHLPLQGEGGTHKTVTASF